MSNILNGVYINEIYITDKFFLLLFLLSIISLVLFTHINQKDNNGNTCLMLFFSGIFISIMLTEIKPDYFFLAFSSLNGLIGIKCLIKKYSHFKFFVIFIFSLFLASSFPYIASQELHYKNHFISFVAILCFVAFLLGNLYQEKPPIKVNVEDCPDAKKYREATEQAVENAKKRKFLYKKMEENKKENNAQ